VLDGTIGTQTVMPFGSAKDVKSMVRKMVEELGKKKNESSPMNGFN